MREIQGQAICWTTLPTRVAVGLEDLATIAHASHQEWPCHQCASVLRRLVLVADVQATLQYCQYSSMKTHNIDMLASHENV